MYTTTLLLSCHVRLGRPPRLKARAGGFHFGRSAVAGQTAQGCAANVGLDRRCPIVIDIPANIFTSFDDNTDVDLFLEFYDSDW